ncbi:transmembrane protein [Ceratobasidium sp. AG-Ba]|nr:transmembrane protein [Ceratobasidium sp. AG-Ba]
MLAKFINPVALQGYEIVPVLRSNPNITIAYWWSTRWISIRSAGNCDPVSLSKKLVFSTNSSLFSYELRSVFNANKQNNIDASSYMANPLSSCTVDSILFAMDIAQKTIKFDTPIFCIGTNLPFSLSIISTFSMAQYNPYYDDIVAYYIQNKPTLDGLGSGIRQIQHNTSSMSNIVGILDAVSTDLFAALYIIANNSIDSPAVLSTGGFFTCPTGRNTTCKAEDIILTIPASGASYLNGTYLHTEGIGTFLSPIEQSISNMFIVLRDAYHIDLGNILSSNTLLNASAFAERIHLDPMVSRVANDTQFDNCSWGLGCTKGTTWTKQLLASNPELVIAIPSVLPSGSAPAVIKVDYLCPQFRIKSPGSLITSVFIGTWTMYTALFGIFGLIGPMLEKRYGRRQNDTAHSFEVSAGEYDDVSHLLTRLGR